MLVKICDVCGERVNVDNYINIEGGFFRNKEKYNDNQKRDLREFDVCMSCARSFNLAQILESIRLSNV